jgi:hypothetical protein
MESLMAEDGYLPTENILVLHDGKKHTVKEGNRRIASLKLIHGYIKRAPYRVPDHIEKAITALSPDWLKNNEEVPCTIYELKDSAKVDRIVSLAHGKGEKAGRDKWEAIARARHARDIYGVSVPALDLLEKYLKNGYNINDHQRERWGGDYPFTVLDEAVKKIAPGFKWNSRELADAYPKKIKERTELESVLLDIGLAKITFDTIRNGNDNYGFPALPVPPATPTPGAPGAPGGAGSPAGGGSQPAGPGQPTPGGPARPAQAVRGADGLTAGGNARHEEVQTRGRQPEKVATLCEEILHLKLDKNPLAFCFLLRSMF